MGVDAPDRGRGGRSDKPTILFLESGLSVDKPKEMINLRMPLGNSSLPGAVAWSAAAWCCSGLRLR